MGDSKLPFQDRQAQPITIFSIGHSNQSLPSFLELLQQHSIQVLIDVRSSPYSKYVPHFNSTALATTIEHANIKYVFMGKELGGRPDGDEFYDDDGHVLYGCVAESPFFLKGIERLIAMGRTQRVAMMCSEEDPQQCHRHLLIGRVLMQQEISLSHIRGDGHLQTEEELTPRDTKPSYTQSLWGETVWDQKGSIWRSIRPVLRRKPQPNSSDL